MNRWKIAYRPAIAGKFLDRVMQLPPEWQITGPGCSDFTHSMWCPCESRDTWPAALAYVDAQIRARALTALEGQP